MEATKERHSIKVWGKMPGCLYKPLTCKRSREIDTEPEVKVFDYFTHFLLVSSIDGRTTQEVDNITYFNVSVCWGNKIQKNRPPYYP